MYSIVKFLNESVKCKVGASTIAGVGVFAIVDIKKGESITDYHYSNLNLKKEFYELDRKHFDLIRPEIRALILDRILFEKGQTRLIFLNPNYDAYLVTFINHSDEPNVEHTALENEFVASRDIAAGEEITFNYRGSYSTFHDMTLKHMPFLK